MNHYLIPMIAILIIISVGAVLYFSYYIKKRKIYKKYLNMESPLSGIEAASMMMQREGYDCKFLISSVTKLDPFFGNFYLPDKNIFIMRREIMDGRNMMSLAIGCQLASSALRYRNGDICRDIATSVDGEYALKYIFNEEELKSLDNVRIQPPVR